MLICHPKLHQTQSLKRDTALATAAIYESMFGAEDGTIPATFQVISDPVSNSSSLLHGFFVLQPKATLSLLKLEILICLK